MRLLRLSALLPLVVAPVLPLHAVETVRVTPPPVVVSGEPVRFIPVFVQPYYEAAKSQSEKPAVSVHRQYDELLRSTRQDDVVKARDGIAKDAALITPMTLMVLAIRCYDTGMRDDSVFWFYAAKARYATLASALDMQSPKLSQVAQATRDFALLAGEAINGYAFCDLKKQRETHARALDWVEKNPYQALFMKELPARPGDQAANAKVAIDQMREAARKEAAHLDDPRNREAFLKARKANKADQRYCW